MERQLSSLLGGLRLTTGASFLPFFMLGWLWLQGDVGISLSLALMVSLLLVTIGLVQCARGPVSTTTRAWFLSAGGLFLTAYLTSDGSTVPALIGASGLYTGALCSVCDDLLEGRFKADIVAAVGWVGAAVATAVAGIMLLLVSWIFGVLGWIAAFLMLLKALSRYLQASFGMLGALKALQREHEPEFLGVTRTR